MLRFGLAVYEVSNQKTLEVNFWQRTIATSGYEIIDTSDTFYDALETFEHYLYRVLFRTFGQLDWVDKEFRQITNERLAETERLLTLYRDNFAEAEAYYDSDYNPDSEFAYHELLTEKEPYDERLANNVLGVLKRNVGKYATLAVAE